MLPCKAAPSEHPSWGRRTGQDYNPPTRTPRSTQPRPHYSCPVLTAYSWVEMASAPWKGASRASTPPAPRAEETGRRAMATSPPRASPQTRHGQQGVINGDGATPSSQGSAATRVPPAPVEGTGVRGKEARAASAAPTCSRSGVSAGALGSDRGEQTGRLRTAARLRRAPRRERLGAAAGGSGLTGPLACSAPSRRALPPRAARGAATAPPWPPPHFRVRLLRHRRQAGEGGDAAAAAIQRGGGPRGRSEALWSAEGGSSPSPALPPAAPRRRRGVDRSRSLPPAA